MFTWQSGVRVGSANRVKWLHCNGLHDATMANALNKISFLYRACCTEASNQPSGKKNLPSISIQFNTFKLRKRVVIDFIVLF